MVSAPLMHGLAPAPHGEATATFTTMAMAMGAVIFEMLRQKIIVGTPLGW